MDVIWTPQRSLWDKAFASAPYPVQQDWAYGDAMMALGGNVLRAQVKKDRKTLALAQFTVRRFGGVVSSAVCSLGPVFLGEFSQDEKREIYQALRQALPLARPRALIFTPACGQPGEGALKGMKRVMTGYSSVIMDVSPMMEEIRKAAHVKWRNRLKVAEKSDLIVEPMGSKPSQYTWLLTKEEGQRKAKGYKATPSELVVEYQKSKGAREGVISFQAREGADVIAGMLFLLHGQGATYHVGWGNDRARRLSAHNYILFRAIEALKAKGVTALDLGGVETHKAPGLARFKIGTGGRVVTYPGTYLS
ncbi:peptidoglycan bridge formation glycyltransferase FemA/FemB family protein [Woodsholea maritima]|uniref:peptidoglycan bridge formation glycyltransferase FemA/FemB family protein n=1 Tax=Woodsholea maritima TaxID=240237 RepID=UPI00035DFF12|nr:peptidoglycan bridge formation glycyltransferase FemA/FemB family protein [Woodsholea maritima]